MPVSLTFVLAADFGRKDCPGSSILQRPQEEIGSWRSGMRHSLGLSVSSVGDNGWLSRVTHPRVSGDHSMGKAEWS